MATGYFEPNKGETPESIRRKRDMIRALMGAQRSPQNVGEGLNALGDGIAAAILDSQADKAETAGMSSATDAFNSATYFPASPEQDATLGSSVDFARAKPRPEDQNVGSTIDFARAEAAGGGADAIRAGLIQRGMPEHIADAFILNFQDESGLKTDINEKAPIVPGSRGGYGLYQLTGPRRTNFEAFAAKQGKDPSDMDAQLDWLMYELEGPENAAAKKIFAAGDTPTAAASIVTDFLRPAKVHRDRRVAKYLGGAAPAEPMAYADPAAGVMEAGAEQGLGADNAGLQALAALAAREGTEARPLAQSGMPAAPAAQTKIAQALTEAGTPDMAGKSGARGMTVQQLMQAMSNPWLSDGQQAILKALLQQEMQKQDPAYQLDMRKTQLDMEKQELEIAKLRNPGMSPYEKEQIRLREAELDAEATKLMELSGGTTVFDPKTRQPIYTAPKEQTQPSAVQEYEYAKSQGFAGTFQDWEASKRGGMSLQVDPATGQVSFQQGANIKPLTEGQSKDTVFATRAEGALPNIDKFGDALTNLPESIGGDFPIIGNYIKSEDFQLAEQAGKEFLQAILRKDTGAAITKEETAEYGSVYLPRPGDSKALLEQKKASRARALEAIKAGMPPQALLYVEKALQAEREKAAPKEKPVTEMTDEELEAIINGER